MSRDSTTRSPRRRRQRSGKLQAVKEALAAALAALEEADLFNLVVFTHRADAFAAAPVPADPSNKEAALAFLNRQDALGVSNFEAGLGQAMQQTFPPGRVNHVIFLTDGLPTVGEIELRALSALVDQWSAGQARLFTLGVGFLSALAEEHQGEAYFLSEEGDIEAALRELFAAFTFPLLRLDELSFDPVEIHDVHPRGKPRPRRCTTSAASESHNNRMPPFCPPSRRAPALETSAKPPP